jgi:hydroxyquinol 1,2-dioxygenase
MIAAPGFETLVTHVFVAGSTDLDSVVRDFELHPAAPAPDGQVLDRPPFTLHDDVALSRIARRVPTA